MTIVVKDGLGVTKYVSATGAGSSGDPFIPQHGVYSSPVQNEIFSKKADTVGDGSGTENMNVDGSSTSVLFKIAPPAGEIWQVTRLILYVEDGGTFDSGFWGNNITLSTGLDVEVQSESFTGDIAEAIKTSGEMTALCFDITHQNFGQGNEFCAWRWTFSKAGGNIRLIGDDGDYIGIEVNDDIDGLVKQYATFQGFKE